MQNNTNTPVGSEWIEELLAEIDKKYVCPNTGCNNNGTIAVQISEDGFEPQQCEYCFVNWFPLKELIHSTLTTVSEQAYREGVETGKKDEERKWKEKIKIPDGVIMESPMGVSQWRNYGIKYGYYDYFKEQIRQELKKEVLEKVQKLIDDNDDGLWYGRETADIIKNLIEKE